MIIQVKSDDGLIQWAAIELHGELEKDNEFSDFVGEIYYLKSGIPVLIIGNHVLHGREIKLDKPMAVLEKQSSEDSNNIEYKLKAVVRKKMVFRTRPKTLAAK